MQDYTLLRRELVSIIRRAPGHDVNEIAKDAQARIMDFAVHEGIDYVSARRAASPQRAYIRAVEDALRRAPPDKTHLRSYAADQGLAPTMSSRRFDGTWRLWQHRSEDGSDRLVLTTSCAIDSTTHLHHRLSQIFALPGGRNTIDLLDRAVADWHATVRGYTTASTLSTAQLEMMARDSRPLVRAMGSDALRGDRRQDPLVRSACSDALQKDERTYDLELQRAGEARAHGTWSLWTSKGHPADDRLVVARTAIDALSYHQCNPHARSRYVAFDGDDTPARNALIDRVVSRMPARSTVVIATDRSREGWQLSGIVQGLAKRRDLHVECNYPSLDHYSWQGKFRESPQRDVAIAQPAARGLVDRPTDTPAQRRSLLAISR